MRKVLCFIALASIVPVWCNGATFSEQIQSAAEVGKTTYLMFHRANNPATQRMAKTIQSVVESTSDRATWVNVNVNDPAAAELVAEFDATRIPLPAVFGLAPNGAVAGVYRMKVSPQQLRNAILSRKHADMIKAMQDQKIAVICFQPAGGGFVPSGVTAFEQDPDFQGQVQLITVAVDEPGEQSFFNRMKVNRNLRSPIVLLFVPPGTHLGTFNSNVSGEALAEKVHSSGQCNCEKCQQRRK